MWWKWETKKGLAHVRTVVTCYIRYHHWKPNLVDASGNEKEHASDSQPRLSDFGLHISDDDVMYK
jgi:hypothetical protein